MRIRGSFAYGLMLMGMHACVNVLTVLQMTFVAAITWQHVQQALKLSTLNCCFGPINQM